MNPAFAHVLWLGVTIALLLIGYQIVLRLIDRLVQRVAAHHLDTARSRTLGSLLTSVVRWVLAFVVLVLVLSEVDVDEGRVAVGAVIQVGAATGSVESIGLRVTKLRLQDGSLRIVPNGALTEFTNFSAGWGRAIVEVAVPRDVDVDRALAVLRGVGEEWARESGAALDAPAVQGIMRFSGGDAVLRLAVRVDAARRLDAENDLRRRIKAAFDRAQLSAVGV